MIRNAVFEAGRGRDSGKTDDPEKNHDDSSYPQIPSSVKSGRRGHFLSCKITLFPSKTAPGKSKSRKLGDDSSSWKQICIMITKKNLAIWRDVES
jgi:hypothetical protein